MANASPTPSPTPATGRSRDELEDERGRPGSPAPLSSSAPAASGIRRSVASRPPETPRPTSRYEVSGGGSRGTPSTPPPPSASAPGSRRQAKEGPAAPRAPSGLGPATPYPLAPFSEDAEGAAQRPLRPMPQAHISPRMTAIFGSIFGLAAVTTAVAMLIQSVPPRDERALVAATSPSSTPEAPKVVEAVKRPKRVAIPGPWRLAELAKDPAVVLVQATMDHRSFVEALGDKNVPKAQAYRILKAFEGVRKFDKTGKKDHFAVALERGTKKVKAFEYEVSPSEIYQARENESGLLAGSKLDLKIAEDEYAGAFYLGSDLDASLQAGGFEEGLPSVLDEALAGRLSTEGFEEGGTVRAIVIEETALGLFSKNKRVVAMEYRPADPAGKATRVYSFTGTEAKGYFDEHGKQPYAGQWRAPVPGAVVTSRFNPKRMHPILHKIMPHQGTDFGASTGTPIYAAYRGVVQSVGPLGPCGNAVQLQHPGGIVTGYCHMSRFAAALKAGDKVGTHQLVGYVGQTGRASGPHLHFFAKRNGEFFDAQTLLVEGERSVAGVDRAAFVAAKAELDRRLDAIALPEPPAEKPQPAAASSSSSPPSSAGSASPASTVAAQAGQVGSPSAIASAAAEPGIHPSGFVEDDLDDDDGKGETIPAPALAGAPLGPAPPSASASKAGKPAAKKDDDDGER